MLFFFKILVGGGICTYENRDQRTVGRVPSQNAWALGFPGAPLAGGLWVPVGCGDALPVHEMKSDVEFQGGTKVSVNCTQATARLTALDGPHLNPHSATSPVASDLHSHH